jgi:small acid-soluble spore protein O
MGVTIMTKSKQNSEISNKQAVKGSLSREYDHEFANEPLTAAEKLNNKKTKKRQ